VALIILAIVGVMPQVIATNILYFVIVMMDVRSVKMEKFI